MEKKLLNSKSMRILFAFFALMLLSFTVNAQTVTGVVIGVDDGQPIPGVNIKIKGTDKGTITDLDGKYSIDVTGEDAVLLFSYVGYAPQDVVVGTQTTIDISLSPGEDLEEVVVVGYGVKKKSLVTGAISSISSEDLQGSKAYVTDELQGKTAGVTILPTSGAPGSSIRVRVRGTSSNGNAEPLYIVDGIKMTDISYIDPSDIGSVEILKDGASSAIYGAEGGNGVILITTKKGKAGDAVINYNFQYGVQSAPKLPELLSGSDYATYVSEVGATENQPGVKANTDWLDEIFETAPIQKHYLSITGGSEKATVMASISYLNQDGILGGSKANYERITGRVNAEYKAKNWLKMGVNVGYSYSDRKNIGEDSRLDGVLGRALLIDPWTPVYHESNDLDHIQDGIDNFLPYVQKDGKYYGVSRYVTGETVNPVLTLDLANGSTKENRVTGSSYLAINPIKNLTITSRLGFNFSQSDNHFYNKLFYYSAERNNRTATVEDQMLTNAKWQWENFATYNKEFGAHNIGLTAGVSIEKGYQRYLRAVSGPMVAPAGGFTEHDYTTKESTSIWGNKFENRVASFFGRVSYDYDNKYMIEASIRRDGAGTSLLPKDNNWGVFPSVSFGWLMSEESFWTIDFISYAKLRASWGENGSLSNLPYWSYTKDLQATGLSYPSPDGVIPVWEASTLGNTDLTWETSQQTDIGLDLRFMNDKLTFTVDYFIKKTNDLLTLGTPSATGGAASPYFNAGDVENKGLEFELGYKNSIGDLNYNVNFNLTSLSNKVTRLDDQISIILGTRIQPGWGGATAFKEGEPIWYFRGYKTEGFNADGTVIISDIDGNGEINSDDMTNIGDPHPDFLYGASLSLDYKGIDFNINIQGSQGNDVLLGWLKTDRSNVNIPKFMFDGRGTSYPLWTRVDDGDGGTKPFDPNFGEAMQSDLLVHDGSFLRIKQIQLGYTLPKFTKNIGISKARFYISLEDFFTFTKYKGMDPEAGSVDPGVFSVGDAKGIGQSQGVDRGAYPRAKRVMFGASITF